MRLRSIVAVVVVVTMLSGCETYRGSMRAAMAGSVMTAAGFGVAGFGDRTWDGFLVGALLVLSGLPLTFGGLAGMASLPKVATEGQAREQEQARSAREVVRRDEQARAARGLDEQRRAAKDRRRHTWAWDLTKTAAQSARDGNCDQVRSLEGEVRTLDPDLHATVFMRDVAIKRCLDAAPAPFTVPAPPVTQPGPTP